MANIFEKAWNSHKQRSPFLRNNDHDRDHRDHDRHSHRHYDGFNRGHYGRGGYYGHSYGHGYGNRPHAYAYVHFNSSPSYGYGNYRRYNDYDRDDDRYESRGERRTYRGERDYKTSQVDYSALQDLDTSEKILNENIKAFENSTSASNKEFAAFCKEALESNDNERIMVAAKLASLAPFNKDKEGNAVPSRFYDGIREQIVRVANDNPDDTRALHRFAIDMLVHNHDLKSYRNISQGDRQLTTLKFAENYKYDPEAAKAAHTVDANGATLKSFNAASGKEFVGSASIELFDGSCDKDFAQRTLQFLRDHNADPEKLAKVEAKLNATDGAIYIGSKDSVRIIEAAAERSVDGEISKRDANIVLGRLDSAIEAAMSGSQKSISAQEAGQRVAQAKRELGINS